MDIYLVGGAVRDQLLGLPVQERDWVVVGATPDEMLKLGYTQVGKEFPVFLHPKTREEYALARKEKKVSPGYTGFVFDTSKQVTLEEDLLRRDLTINAMAETSDGTLIDPYHGKADLDHKILRHVSAAFSEDPVRILRVARFAARYHRLGFTVAATTNELMKTMVASKEVDALVSERVWKELERALGEPSPQIFFKVLEDCGALAVLFPMISMQSLGIETLTLATKNHTDTRIRLAALLHLHTKAEISWLAKRYRFPRDYTDLALITANYHQRILEFRTLSAEDMLALFSATDAFRREDRFYQFLAVCTAIAETKNIALSLEEVKKALTCAQQIDTADLISQSLEGFEIGQRIKERRLKALASYKNDRI